jgi:ABC-type protease/lipase transport system fused ATPase/permease subunit
MAIAGNCEEAHATLWGGAAFVLGTQAARWQLMRWRLVRVVAVSGMLALLNLSTSVYLLAVYDYVLPRGSLAALGAITLLVCLLHVSFVALEQARARKICQVGVGFIEELDSQLLRVVASERPASCVVLLEDVERVRRFLAGGGPCAMLDLMWLPAFLIVLCVLHPAFGLFALVGISSLVALSIRPAVKKRGQGPDISAVRAERFEHAQHVSLASASLGRGILGNEFQRRWRLLSRHYAEATSFASRDMLRDLAFAKGGRLTVHSLFVGLGTLLSIEGAIGYGALFAALLVLGRTLACLDGALAHWRTFTSACESHRRLTASFAS